MGGFASYLFTFLSPFLPSLFPVKMNNGIDDAYSTKRLVKLPQMSR